MVKDVATVVAASVGLFFSLSGVVGILRMPDLYSRVQCSSKTITMGALPALIAVTIGQGWLTSFGSRALIVGFLLVVVNPMSSHALVRAAYKVGIPIWRRAVYDQPAARRAQLSDVQKEGFRALGD
jgi:multicomponent Na+:H+ antiporter subunit G